jgi:probable HAF family extracellular repeat protein
MKSRTFTTLAAITFFAALALPLVSSAQEEKNEHHHYKLFDVGTFGGPEGLFSNPGNRVINNRGTATGDSDTSVPDPYFPNCFYDCFVDHGFMWKDGVTTDLGTLPGGLSSFPVEVNNGGLIVGQSQNGSIDPLTGTPEVRSVLWRKGQIIDLGTLGGNASNASAINDRGQVVGAATNATLDPFASAPQGACKVLPSTLSCSGSTFSFNSLFSNSTTETHAVLWQHGFMLDLGTLGGPDSTAWFTNDCGEVAGWSYNSFVANPSTGTPTVDPFLWSPDDGKMTDLGSLGGTFGAPFFLNNRGQVVGISNLPGDTVAHPFLWTKFEGMKDMGTLGGTFGFPTWISGTGKVVGASNIAGDQDNHAFLWSQGVMTDLGTVGTDHGSEAFTINSQGQIVGDSGSYGVDLHGFLWEADGPMVDLNELVIPGSGATVVTAVFINEFGEIAGTARFPNGGTHPVPVLLIPCDENHPEVEGCDYSTVEVVTEAPIRSAQIIQAPAASPTSLSPAETITPLQPLNASRNRRHRMPQTSPK